MTGFWANLLAFLAKTSPYWGVLFASLGLSLLLTPICRAIAVRMGMVDNPSARRINKTPIPSGTRIFDRVLFSYLSSLPSI